MADRRSFVWQQSLSITAVSVALCFLAGFRFAGERAAESIAIPSLFGRQDPLAESSTVAVATAQSNEAYRAAIAQLVEAERARRLNFSVPVPFQGKTLREVKVEGNQKVIALTFDDGPWSPTTSQILKVLEEYEVEATFFVVGKQVQKYPQILQQIVAGGHAIGNHTWSHQYDPYSESAAARELNDTAALIYETTGVKTALFRPPAGILNNGLAAYARQEQYAVVMWSADSKDWRYRNTTAKSIADNVLESVQPGGIVLLHDGGGDRADTVEALPQIITALKKHGYQFVTVPELLEMGSGGAGEQRSRGAREQGSRGAEEIS